MKELRSCCILLWYLDIYLIFGMNIYPLFQWSRNLPRHSAQIYEGSFGQCYIQCWIRSKCRAISYRSLTKHCLLHSNSTTITMLEFYYQYSEKDNWKQDEIQQLCESSFVHTHQKDKYLPNKQCQRNSDHIIECWPLNIAYIRQNYGSLGKPGSRMRFTCMFVDEVYYSACTKNGTWDVDLDICDSGADTNLALGKPTWQSTTHEIWRGTSEKAVDGNTEGHYDNDTCTHTNDSPPPHAWGIDLLRQYPIVKVVIYNREDCCGERLSHLSLLVRSEFTGKNTWWDSEKASNCTYFLGPPTGNPITLMCDSPQFGRYLQINKSSDETLTLCEVEIYATSGIS